MGRLSVQDCDRVLASWKLLDPGEQVRAGLPWASEPLLTQLQGGLSIGVVAPLEELRPEEPERILGGVFLQDRSDAWEIAMLWLSPECRGRGLMRSLVTGLQNGQWLSLSSRRWWLEVHADNQAALGLYEGLGFRTTGRRRGYYGPGADAILMEWQALP